MKTLCFLMRLLRQILLRVRSNRLGRHKRETIGRTPRAGGAAVRPCGPRLTPSPESRDALPIHIFEGVLRTAACSRPMELLTASPRAASTGTTSRKVVLHRKLARVQLAASVERGSRGSYDLLRWGLPSPAPMRPKTRAAHPDSMALPERSRIVGPWHRASSPRPGHPLERIPRIWRRFGSFARAPQFRMRRAPGCRP